MRFTFVAGCQHCNGNDFSDEPHFSIVYHFITLQTKTYSLTEVCTLMSALLVFSYIIFLVYICFQALVAQCEANMSEHQLYYNKVTDWTDFIRSLRDKLDVCSDSSDDVRAVEVQLERLQVCRHNTHSVVLKYAIFCIFLFY